MPDWWAYTELTCTILAGWLWYALPQLGPWPLLLALAPWVARLALTGRLTLRSPFDLPLVLFLATAALGVWAAYDRQVAWSKFWPMVGGILLFYAFANIHSMAAVQAWLLTIVAAGMTLYFVVTNDWLLYTGKVAMLSRLGQALQAPFPPVPGPRLNPNEVGGILAILAPFAGWTAFQTWQGIRDPAQPRSSVRWLALTLACGALALILFGLLMTTSRGAWIALGGALLLGGLWSAAGWLSRRNARRRVWAFVGLVALMFIGVLVVGLAVPRGPATPQTALFSVDSWFSRADLQRNSLMLVRDYPFVGAGLGGFQMLYSTYILLVHVGFISSSHNLFLEVAIDQGLPGLLALVWMWILFAGIAWQSVVWPRTSQERAVSASPLLGIAALSVVTLLIHGTVENALYTREGILLLFVPLAFAVPAWRPGGQRARRWQWAVPSLCVGLPLALMLAQPGKALSRVYSNVGAVRQSQAELSVYAWPEWPIQDAVRRAVDLSRPVGEFEQALALDPQNPTANRRLAMIELSLGQYPDALEHLEAAYAAEPTSMTTQQLLGEALIVNGRVDEGQALWSSVSDAQDQLAIRAFWYQYIGDAQRAAWLQQAATGR